MSLKEEFLTIDNYKDFMKKREHFREIDLNDQEISDHYNKLMHIPPDKIAEIDGYPLFMHKVKED